MEIVLRWFASRPMRFVGGFLVFLSLGLLVFLVFLDIVVGLGNPYLGIIAYLILPAVLITGLILVPLDSWIQRRRAARGLPITYATIDLCEPRQRKIAGFFVGASIAILVIMTAVTYKGVEYMDTVTFCGKVCHRVMIPEYTAYLRSAHASVSCVECHIGPGAPWFVRSKLTGIPQIWHYTVGDYPRPLPAPVRTLRPSRETCERCHWPEEFYGDLLKTTITFDQDRNNTRVVKSMILHVGSGGVYGSGIHSHMMSRIDYLPAVEKRTQIAWVRVVRPDGSTQEFVNPTYKDNLPRIRKAQEVRLMDCIDCHNRAAHDFVTFQTLLDGVLIRNKVDRSLPYIKREAMRAVGEISHLPTKADQMRTARRIRDIESFYKREFPDLYKARAAAIRRSIKAIEEMYLDTAFPNMRVWPGTETRPGTYPNWRGHATSFMEGCFRCHGVMEAAGPTGRDRDISGDCSLCHAKIEGG